MDVAWEMEEPNGTSVHDRTYYKLKAKLGLKSQYLCSARNKAVEMVKSAKALIKSGKKVSKPKVGRIPIRLDGRTLSFDKTRENASIATQDGRIKVPLNWHKQAKRYEAWDCEAGEIGKDRKGRWVIRLIFKKIFSKPERTGRVVGGDRGIKKPLVTSDNKFLGKPEWKEREKKYLSHIARLQSKGTRSAKRRLKKIKGRLRRFKQDCDYRIAKELMAGLRPGDTFVHEKLTNIRDNCGRKGQANKKHRRYVGRWSFKRLENIINYIAETMGIYIGYVDPRYTSQTCSKCGIVCKNNRKSQSLYSCSCGCRLNARSQCRT